jgi:O-antigen ligase
MALFMAWVAGFAGLILIRSVKGSSVDLRFLILVVILMALSPFLGLRYTAGLSAAIWSWYASTTNSAILRFFRFLLVLGVAEALLGLYQHFAAPGWIFGYQNVVNPVTGTLINRNHFAGLLEMLIPISFGLAYAGRGRDNDPGKTYVFVLAGSCMAVALAFSLSRMGLICFVTTLVLMGILIRLRNRDKRFGTALGLGLFGLFFIGTLWIGIDSIVQRFEANKGDVIVEETRASVFRDTLRMISQHPFGIGSDNYRDTFRQYQTAHTELLFDHAHNDYLETAAEWGIPAGVVFWALIWSVQILCIWRFVITESPEKRGILLACAGSMFSLLLHSFVDFNLQIPSNAILFFAIVGVAARLVMSPRARPYPRSDLSYDRASTAGLP